MVFFLSIPFYDHVNIVVEGEVTEIVQEIIYRAAPGGV